MNRAPETEEGPGMAQSATDCSVKKRKRQRPIISCTECHRRKQKCDRAQPCSNCTLRAASHLCRYDTKPRRSSSAGSDTRSPGTSEMGQNPVPSTDVGSNFGYVRTMPGNTAVDVLEKLNLEENVWGKDGTYDIPEQVELQHYIRLVSSIPPRPYVMLLVKVFFTEANWMYGMVHEVSFYQSLDQWYSACTSSTPPCPAHNKAAYGDNRKLLAQFPTLILQVLALALQMLPREHYRQIGQLNFGKEDFKGLSAKYSNSACELATLLAVNCATLPRVQHWFLRGSWLKSEGRGVEAWHALGQGIREAQEIGLHKEQSRKYMGAGEDMYNLWQRELEKRVWVNLYIWDRFMSMILGRPTMINDRHCTVSPPVDCHIPVDFKTPPIPRGPLDPPTPFTQRLLNYQLAHLINEIDDMQLQSSKLLAQDFAEVDRLHAKVLSYAECFPPSLALHDRDPSQDSGNPFLHAKAEMLKCAAFSLIVGLHRPFIFVRDKSRYEIVKAGLCVLESQDSLIGATREHHHTIYTLNFFTFDPAVLIAAVLITAPSSLDSEVIGRCMLHLKAACTRMELLGKRTKLAEKGAAVLRLLAQKADSSIASYHTQRIANMSSSPSSASSPSSMQNCGSSQLLNMHGEEFHRSAAGSRSSVSSSIAPDDTRGLQQDISAWTPENLPHHGPISTSLLSAVELDDLLLGSFADGSLGLNGMGPPDQAHTTFPNTMQAAADIIGDENFWQNLLNVPFP